jgi:MoCo/4Fe-4S cofactor protein with predicted Tat translocation signal
MPPEANDAAAPTPPQLWRGLEEYLDSPAFRAAMANEFPEDAAEWTDPVSRRNFLTIMGAGLALAGAAGCTPRPASMRKIVPYTRQPEQMTPGVPLFFASAAPLAGYVSGVLVRSHEGRPVKVEGNPDHPSSLGGTGVATQASVLDLYDPDRSQTPTRYGTEVPLAQALDAVRAQLFDNGQPRKDVKLRVLTGAVTSPTLADRVGALLNQFPDARWVQYEPCGLDNAREGARRAFGRELAVHYDFTKADVVLALDADFLCDGPGGVRYSRDFASRRRVRTSIPAGGQGDYVDADRMSRLYAVECMPTSTGSVADHRLPLLAGQVEGFARALAAALGVPGATAVGTLPDAARKWVEALRKDLDGKKGASVVVAGDHQPPAVHALALAINAHLQNLGATVHVTAPVEARPDGKMSDLATLVREMNADQVKVLLILGGTNPAYTAPADLDFAGALAKVPFKFHLGTHQDETAALCDWHVNEAHYLETWGDGRGHDGTVALQQPLIAPLYNGRSAVEVLGEVTKDGPTAGYDILRGYWQRRFDAEKRPGVFDPWWQETVRLGVVAGTAAARQEKPALAPNWADGAAPAYPAPTGDDYEINFRADPTLFDGRFANNGWLQELPKPVTRIGWDNAAYVSKATADKLGVTKEFRWTGGERGRAEVSILTVTHNQRTVKLPVWILPGHPDNAVTVHLGHGRERAGRVGNIPDQPNAEGKPVRGSNAYALRTSAAPAFAPRGQTRPHRRHVPPRLHPGVLGDDPGGPDQRRNPRPRPRSAAARSRTTSGTRGSGRCSRPPPAKPTWSAGTSPARPGRRTATPAPSGSGARSTAPGTSTRTATTTRTSTTTTGSFRSPCTTRTTGCTRPAAGARPGGGAWPSTSAPAPGAGRAWWRARARTTSRRSGSTRSPAGTTCTGSGWTGTTRGRSTSRTRARRTSCRSRASSARRPRARSSARWPRPSTRPTGSTTWCTTAASAPGTARTTARTRSGGSTS